MVCFSLKGESNRIHLLFVISESLVWLNLGHHPRAAFLVKSLAAVSIRMEGFKEQSDWQPIAAHSHHHQGIHWKRRTLGKCTDSGAHSFLQSSVESAIAQNGVSATRVLPAPSLSRQA